MSVEPGAQSGETTPIITGPLTWSSVIGLYLLNFSSLEMLVFTYIQKCLPDEFEKWRDRHFKERVEHVGEHFARTPEQRAAYAAFLERLTPVRELRNHLAHGYLQMIIYPGDQGHVIAITQAKDVGSPFNAETKKLTFPELLAALADLNKVTQEFQRLTDQAAGWKAD